MNRFYDNAGLNLTEMFEDSAGPALNAYWDPTGNVWTIGYGHTGPEVKEGLVWTTQQCIAALAADVSWASVAVNHLVTRDISQSQFDALVDFVFNEGVGSFAKSTLLEYVNEGNLQGAEAEFGKWVYSGGKVLGGLTRRRAAEAALFLQG